MMLGGSAMKRVEYVLVKLSTENYQYGVVEVIGRHHADPGPGFDQFG
jgi:hypothetical protein